MKMLCLLTCALCAIATAILGSGCASPSLIPVPVRQLHTYAIVAVDDQGILSRTELNKVEDTLVQFLIDQGYVRNNQTLVDDPSQADAVFRINLSWNAARSSFAIVNVTPSSGAAAASAIPPPVYVDGVPWPADDWAYDPWIDYGDDFGYAYGPCSPFLAVFPFFPYYGFEHYRRPLPPIVRHSQQENRPPSDRHQPAWTRDRGHVTPWIPGNETKTAGSSLNGHRQRSWNAPASPSIFQPLAHRRVQDRRENQPQSNARTPVRPANSDHRSPPAVYSRREGAPAQLQSHSISQREQAMPERTGPSRPAMPARESAATARSSPPAERSVPAASSRAPASSNDSSGDSKSKSSDRER
jgi:hypothetical protein